MSSRSGSAPGRLDLMGGVADYSGALVLEMPTRGRTTVVATPDSGLAVGPAVLAAPEFGQLLSVPYPEVRAALAGHPRWTLYLFGVALVLARHGVIETPRVRLDVSSDVPTSVGVASSAALEVATARALGAQIDPIKLARLCQEAENQVVGAPCGVMDQVAVAAGQAGSILPILCRPASLKPVVAVRPDLEIVGWPTGAEHDVGGTPYRQARAAAFMGKRIVEVRKELSCDWVSELPAAALAELPDELRGAAFLEHWEHVDDVLTTVVPEESYPIRAAATFGAEEHARSLAMLDALGAGDLAAVGSLMAASDAGYRSMGLGHPAAASTVAAALSRPGVHGARSSGGGCGGTVVVVCEKGSLDDVEGLIR